MTDFQKEFINAVIKKEESQCPDEEPEFYGFANENKEQNEVIFLKVENTDAFAKDDVVFLKVEGDDDEEIENDYNLAILFKCDVCSRCFADKTECEEHVNGHEDDDKESLLCTDCGMLFIRKQDLSKHMLDCHPDKFEEPTKESIKKDETILECGICADYFYLEEDLLDHFNLHLNKECSVCSQKFISDEELKEHSCGKTHVPKVNGRAKYKIRDKNPKVNNGSAKCRLCDKVFINERSYKSHLRNHGTNPYLCTLCGKSIKTSTDFKRHMNIHEGNKPFKCSYCNYRCSKKSNLVTHTRLHTGETPYQCEKCGERFTYKTAFNNHVLTHDTEKMFYCAYCDKKFVAYSILIAHERSHTGERPYSCGTCRRSFSARSTLKKHMKLHSKDYCFICHVCGRAFKSKASLDTHLQLHAGKNQFVEVMINSTKMFRCIHCDKLSRTSNNALRHLKIHTGEKPFVCVICGRGFSEKASLKGHIRIHTDERPFKCEFCNSAFRDRSVLRRHIRRRHTVANEVEIELEFAITNEEERPDSPKETTIILDDGYKMDSYDS